MHHLRQFSDKSRELFHRWENWGTEKANYFLVSSGCKIQSLQHQSPFLTCTSICMAYNLVTFQTYLFWNRNTGEEGGGTGGEYLERDWGFEVKPSWGLFCSLFWGSEKLSNLFKVTQTVNGVQPPFSFLSFQRKICSTWKYHLLSQNNGFYEKPLSGIIWSSCFTVENGKLSPEKPPPRLLNT